MDEKITIKPDGTLIGRAVEFDRYFSSFLMRVIFLLIWLAGISSFMTAIWAAFFSLNLNEDSLTVVEGAVGDIELPIAFNFIYVFIGIFLIYLPLKFFYQQKVKNPKAISPKDVKSKLEKGEQINLFSIFSFELAISAMSIFKARSYPSSQILALALLTSKELDFILVRLGISRDNLILDLEKNNYDSNVGSLAIIKSALESAIAENHEAIQSGDVFIALCQLDPYFQKLLSDLELELCDVANVVYWQDNLKKRVGKNKGFLNPNVFNFTGGIGRDWAFGYAPLILQYGQDFTEAIQSNRLDLNIIGREKEINQIEETLLRRNGGNVILVGEPGVGKKSTVLGLASKMAKGELDSRLAFKHLIEIDVRALISGSDPETRLNELFNEVIHAGNLILFIENIENLLSGNGVGSINAAELMLPFLNSHEVHVIATCSADNYNSLIRPATALAERFERITLEEPNEAATIRILEDVMPQIEAETKSIISYEAIKTAVEMAKKYITDVPNPEKSIDLLDGAVVHATKGQSVTIILPKDISAYVSTRFNVPAGEVKTKEKNQLLRLETIMHERVIGQDEAIKAVANAMRRARAGIRGSKKPIGSFLFLGPTGVGKTETAKALAAAYFGGDDRMIRFDMSEYQSELDIYRFIGTAGSPGALTTAVREHPFSLFLFDEIEKADPHILDLFLQILDEGQLTDGTGRKASFSNTIIICTSNAGANLIRESILNGSNYETTKEILIDFIQKENIYRPELINRFTQVIVFSPLSEIEISQIAELMIKDLKEIVHKNQGVGVEIAPEALALLARQGFDREMGARSMARVIQEKVENLLAQKILSGEIKRGDNITINTNDLASR